MFNTMKEAPSRCLSKFLLCYCCQKEKSNSSHLLPLVLAHINSIPDFIDLCIYRDFDLLILNMCLGTHVEVRGQLKGVNFPLPCASDGSDSGQQAQPQAPAADEPACQPLRQGFARQLRSALNLKSSYLSFLSAGIIGACYQSCLNIVFEMLKRKPENYVCLYSLEKAVPSAMMHLLVFPGTALQTHNFPVCASFIPILFFMKPHLLSFGDQWKHQQTYCFRA